MFSSYSCCLLSFHLVFLLVVCSCLLFFICYFLMFCSVVLIHDVHFLCIHLSCSLAFYLRFLLMYHLFPTSSSYSSSPSFSFVSFLLLFSMYCSNMTPPKTQHENLIFVFIEKTGPGLADFTKTVFYGKIWLYAAECEQILGCFSTSQKHNFIKLTHKFSEAIEATHQRVPKNLVFIVFCHLHLYIKTQLLETFASRGVKTGPFFSDAPTCMLRNTITKTHIFRETTDHTCNTPKTSQIPMFAVRN